MLEQRADGLTTYILDPEQLGIVLAPGTRQGEVSRVQAGAILDSDPSILAILDGPMYSSCPPPTATPRCALLDYLYLDRRAGIDHAGRYPARGMTLSIKGNQAFVALAATVAPQASFAIQLYPSLIWQGQNVASSTHDTDTVWRAAIGGLPDGRLVLAIGRFPMRVFAERLRALGLVWAGYTDGGGSTSLAVRGLGRYGSTEDRAVASWLVVRSTGSRGSTWLGLGLLAAAGWAIWKILRK